VGDEFTIGGCEEGYGQERPKVVFGENTYFVAWVKWKYLGNGTYYKSVWGNLITPSGEVIEPSILIADSSYLWALSYGAGVFLCIISKKESMLYGVRVTINGVVLDSVPFLITDSYGPSSACFDGENFVVCWICKTESGDELRVVKVSPEGKVLGEPVVLDKTGYYFCFPDIVNTKNYYFIIYGCAGYYYSDLLGVKLTKDLTNAQQIEISCNPARYEGTLTFGQSVSYNGEKIFVAYGGGIPDVSLIILNENLGRITSLRLDEGDCCWPIVAHNNKHFMIIWAHGDKIIGSLFTPNGKIIDINTITPIADDFNLAGAFGQFLVVYQRQTSPDWQSDRIFGRIVWDVEACREHFVAYPNPCRDFINLQLIAVGDEEVEVKVYDIMGRLRMRESFQLKGLGVQEFPLNLSNLSRGVYILKVKRNNNVSQQKICKF